MTENAKNTAATRKYKNAADLEAAIDTYFDEHNSRDNIPKWPQMLIHLGLSDEMLQLYQTDERYIKRGYLDCFKNAERRLSSTLIQLAVDNPNLHSLVIFLLKQPHNGGYTDKPQQQSSGNMVVELVVKGAD